MNSSTWCLESLFKRHNLFWSLVSESWKDFASQPTFLRFMPLLGLDVQTGMKLLCVAGVILALFSFGWCYMRNSVTYFLLWSFYLSLFRVRTVALKLCNKFVLRFLMNLFKHYYFTCNI